MNVQMKTAGRVVDDIVAVEWQLPSEWRGRQVELRFVEERPKCIQWSKIPRVKLQNDVTSMELIS
jgi:hypothetical protein